MVVREEMHPAYQVRRYGWSAKLPISIITDFEEFSVYDCTKRPKQGDKASVARIKYLTFRDYLKEFDFLWDTFSKEKVLKGSFDKLVQSDRKKRGTATVDIEFLKSLDSWRTYLAKSISRGNQSLSEDEINFVVQQTLDRIVFLRIAEDRGVEFYGSLKEAIKQGDFYQNLFQQFQQADAKYNSGLFDFKKDNLSREVVIDNKTIKTIVNELYYPESPYEFSVLSVEILGSAYEQFLGKVIRITSGHSAKVEEKPEVRKAGGVYYTPQYIVDYIVMNTVGQVIKGKTPDDVSKIKILDPACGSGSFLLGAYQYLLDWHKNYYLANGFSKERRMSRGKKGDVLRPDGELSTAEKKRILLNNIFGVDIDLNAVEVTKLSLLLKCMEGETEESISNQLSLFNERVLPTLDENVRSGNSLVDIDYYDSNPGLDEDKNVRPFNWKKTFPKIFSEQFSKKSLTLFHVTCVMHNTRVSQRMVDYHVKRGIPENLGLAEEEKLVEILCRFIVEDNLRVLALNVCADHLHFVIASDPEELSNVVGRLKSKSARAFNIWRGVTVARHGTRGHAPLSEGHGAPLSERHGAPLLEKDGAPLSGKDLTSLMGGGSSPEKVSSLWAQKFNRVEICSSAQMYNTIEYVTENRNKHGLPPFSDATRQLVRNTILHYEDALRPHTEQGGFDVVLGNPPWVDIKGQPSELVQYYFKRYSTAENRINLYSLFIERGLSLLSDNGLFGFIIPNSILYQSSYERIRKHILLNYGIEKIVRLPDNVFQNVKAETIVLNLKKGSAETECIIYDRVDVISEINDLNCKEHKVLNAKDWLENEFCVYDIFSSPAEKSLLKKIEENCKELGTLCDLTLGITPYDKYRGHSHEQIRQRVFHANYKKDETFKPLLEGADVKRYSVDWGGKEYISYGKWLGAPREKRFFTEPRILVRQIVSGIPLRIYAGFTTEELYNTQTVFNIISKDEDKLPMKYLLALLNSNLMNFYHRFRYLDLSKNLFQKILIQNCKKFPVRLLVVPEEKKAQAELIDLVNQIILLTKEHQKVRLITDKEQLQSRIDYVEARINSIIYALYGLSQKEIEIIERNG